MKKKLLLTILALATVLSLSACGEGEKEASVTTVNESVEEIEQKELLNLNDGTFTIEEGVLIEYKGSGGNVVIPDGVTRIERSVFNGCKNLTSIEIPNSVKEIYNRAFSGCKSLKSIVFPEESTTVALYIEKSVFSGCKSLTSVKFPDRPVYLSDDCFRDCTNLTRVEFICESYDIHRTSISGCTALEEVIINGTPLPEELMLKYIKQK